MQVKEGLNVKPMLHRLHQLPTHVLLTMPAILSAAALGAALLMQYVGGLPPCEMCIWQRWPYGVVIVLSLGAYFAHRLLQSPSITMMLMIACITGFLTVAGLAAYHTAVEQGWVTANTGCAGNAVAYESIDDLREAIFAAPAVRCDEPAFTLFGLSIAGMNMLAALAFAALTAYATILFKRRRQP